ncbi:MAG: tetratricopeptide repeat protein [Proteobacteria bacterium]|nr:tetratricopeptide repeat protein [Pseudomonadota bacterium]
MQHILEGSVRKSGNRIRVTDTHLWSENYDRELDDIFAIQDDIDDTHNAKAYEYFLRGRGYAMSKNDRETELAGEMFKKAADQDPGFVRAWLNLAEMCAIHAVFYQNKDRTHWRTIAREAGDRLMELSPNSAESNLASAYALTAEGDFAAAETAFEKAIELDSTMGIAYQYLARAQLHQGKMQAAAASYSAATECDPDDYESPLLGVSIYDDLEDYPDNQRAYYLGASGHTVLGHMDNVGGVVTDVNNRVHSAATFSVSRFCARYARTRPVRVYTWFTPRIKGKDNEKNKFYGHSWIGPRCVHVSNGRRRGRYNGRYGRAFCDFQGGRCRRAHRSSHGAHYYVRSGWIGIGDERFRGESHGGVTSGL